MPYRWELRTDGPARPWPDAADRLVATITALARTFPGEAGPLRLTPAGSLSLGRGRLWLAWHDPGGGRTQLRVGTKPQLNPVLEERLPDVAALVAELGRLWRADYAWIDMPHVRREWNRTGPGHPVFSLATWLAAAAAHTDTTGLDVDTTDTPDGRLIVLRRPAAAIGNDEEGTLSGGRALVEALTARTTRPAA
ncbi:hypothetical protein Dvina_22180 [Dactylosporangium vinaceum]|uniref:Uncharacterized protein n=1 Tax=Dactylosporangium vinaceum TaxID=53362 RepID=A0ABV5MR92_9ACTN|nr:hypothetical protein [Dactylosporangium vinaceum]UAC00520.1 hypothetical protein Dvina_22180 [Dactylosporangium vinaceum]